ncbi:hypothetical protein ACFL2B_02570 [Patescibacteria group bacterium]
MLLKNHKKVNVVAITGKLRERLKLPVIYPGTAYVSEFLRDENVFTSAVVFRYEDRQPMNTNLVLPTDLADASNSHFGENGLIRVGTEVKKGICLYKIIDSEKEKQRKKSQSENLGTRMISKFEDTGIVTKAEVIEDHKFVIEIMIRRVLRIGDILTHENNQLIVAGFFSAKRRFDFDNEDIDVLINKKDPFVHKLRRTGKIWISPSVEQKTKGAKLKLTKETIRANQKWNGVNRGTQSYLTLAPSYPAAKISDSHTKALAKAGFIHNLGEIMTIKSCDHLAYPDLRPDIIHGGLATFPCPHFTEKTYLLFANLKALGIASTYISGGKEINSKKLLPDFRGLRHYNRHLNCMASDFSWHALQLRLADRKKIRQWSSGRVTIGETGFMRYGKYVCHPSGLESFQIFGPHFDDDARYENRFRFGHFELPQKMLNPLFVEKISEVTGISAPELEGLITGKLGIVQDSLPGEVKIIEIANKKRPRLTLTRDRAIQAVLQAFDLPDEFLLKVLPILPRELRTGDQILGSIYRFVIGCARRLKRLQELKAPNVILLNERRMLQERINKVMLNEDERRMSGFAGDSAAEALQKLLKGFSQTRSRFSISANVIPDQKIERDRVIMPKAIASLLYRYHIFGKIELDNCCSIDDEIYNQVANFVDCGIESPVANDCFERAYQDHPLLAISPQRKIAVLYPELNQDPAMDEVIRVHPDVCRELQLQVNKEQLSLHLPLSQLAIDELKDPGLRRPIENPESNLANLTLDDIIEHSISEEPIKFSQLDQLILYGQCDTAAQ